jgi:hypothetical protein
MRLAKTSLMKAMTAIRRTDFSRKMFIELPGCTRAQTAQGVDLAREVFARLPCACFLSTLPEIFTDDSNIDLRRTTRR